MGEGDAPFRGAIRAHGRVTGPPCRAAAVRRAHRRGPPTMSTGPASREQLGDQAATCVASFGVLGVRRPGDAVPRRRSLTRRAQRGYPVLAHGDRSGWIGLILAGSLAGSTSAPPVVLSDTDHFKGLFGCTGTDCVGTCARRAFPWCARKVSRRMGVDAPPAVVAMCVVDAGRGVTPRVCPAVATSRRR